ncbi:hypothetical protein [uncultured Brachyspira sp.]|uniref:hypothetical protein n=1 Tax=uncultured Brachyspira sp. TaxID=221953 RepID=UPI00262BE3FA|nr:hypothetical protein [uncultured Brachyspira sp.]
MNITKLIDNDELKKDIEEFTNKLKKRGCIHVIGIVPKNKKGIFIQSYKTSRDTAMILNAILLNLDDKVVSVIKELYNHFKGKNDISRKKRI